MAESAAKPGQETAWDLLEKDHRALTSYMSRIKKALSTDPPSDQLKDLKEKFSSRLLAHFEAEETTVFPVLLASSGGSAREGLDILRVEHQEMRQLIQRFLQSPLETGPATLTFNVLRESIQNHQAREKRVLYPISEILCPPELADLIANRIRHPNPKN